MARSQELPKKLIEYGHDVPSPDYAAKHIREMEERPFDGVMMRVGGYSNVFRCREFDEKAFKRELDVLRSVEWEGFTDNFVMVYASSDQEMDWFSDKDWERVLRNVGLCARAARAGRCKGITFDAEPYWGKGAWKYDAQLGAGEKSFAEFQEVVRKRGAQFIGRLQEEFPDPVVHTFFLLSIYPHIPAEPDPDRREEMLKGEFYGLLPAFLNGMLEAASPGTVITDGNEGAYYYTSSRRFLESYHAIRQTCQALVAPELRGRYRSQVQCSQALYIDNLCSLRIDQTPGAFLTAEERARWVEHNVYWALTTSDCYVWLYSQHMNWWTRQGMPPELEEAVASARRKVAAGEPLGVEIADLLERASRELSIAGSAPLRPRTASVRRLKTGEAPPVIDGRIDEEVWQKSRALDYLPFLIARVKDLEARTRALLVYDDKHLYIAVRCEEPEMAALVPGRRDREQMLWAGDWVSIVLAPRVEQGTFFHIAVNPNNERWDALIDSRDPTRSLDSSWSPDYQSAVHRGDDSWSVELAIPWSALEMGAPQAGEKLAANLIRRRGSHREYSSWSRSRIARWPELENFGTWVFEG